MLKNIINKLKEIGLIYFISIVIPIIIFIYLLIINLFSVPNILSHLTTNISCMDLKEKSHWIFSSLIQGNMSLIGLFLVALSLTISNRKKEKKVQFEKILYLLLINTVFLMLTIFCSLIGLFQTTPEKILVFLNIAITIELLSLAEICLILLKIYDIYCRKD